MRYAHSLARTLISSPGANGLTFAFYLFFISSLSFFLSFHFPSKELEEVVSEPRNWKGIIIALLVIISICSVISAAILFLSHRKFFPPPAAAKSCPLLLFFLSLDSCLLSFSFFPLSLFALQRNPCQLVLK